MPSEDLPTVQEEKPDLDTNLQQIKLNTPTGPAFQYSACTGQRKAVCIGINYKGLDYKGTYNGIDYKDEPMKLELHNCVEDARSIREFLIERGNYQESDIVLLTDDTCEADTWPTKDNILRAMRWLVKDAKPHDALFFHYSGHGNQTPDLDGDEEDGFDEAIWPLDIEIKGHITDDEMHEIMVKSLPRGCRLTALFDSCHSGTVLDLPFIYSSHGKLRKNHLLPEWQQAKTALADVISWTGCTDRQVVADGTPGVKNGAMSYAFLTALTDAHLVPKKTYREVFHAVREILKPNFSQKAQLGSSHPIDTNLEFIF